MMALGMIPARPWLAWLASLALLALFSCSGAAEEAPDAPPADLRLLDLAGFEPSFSEEFDRLDVSEWGCLTKWIAHTPWAGDFGSARFMPPGEAFPFTIRDGVLTITARRRAGGSWQSGMLSAWDACNSGFAQRYGYFETRMRMPEAPGFWPAFWLIGVDKSRGTAEVDVVEFLTHEPDRFSLGLMKHPAKEGEERQSFTTKHVIEPGLLSRQFNTFGVEIAADATTFYLNRQPIWRAATPPEFDQPMYPLISFPADKNRMDKGTPDNVTMEVDYVRAYQRKPIGF